MSFKKALLTYGAADAFSKSIGLITSPITTRLFTMSQYGTAPLLEAVWSPFALGQYGGMDWAYPFFYARKKTQEEGKRLIVNATIFAYLFVLMVWFIFLIFAFTNNWLAKYANITSGELSFYILGIIPAALINWLCYLLRFMHRADSFVKITILGRILPIIVVLPLLPFFEQDKRLFISFALGWMLSCIALLYALYEIRRVGHWPFKIALLDIKLCKEMFHYGILLVPAGAAYALMVVMDRLLIGFFLGTESVALHALAFGLGSLGIMFVNWFGLAFDPYLSSWISKGNQENYLPKMQLLVSSLAIMLGSLSCLAAIWASFFVNILYPNNYSSVAQLVPLIIFAAALTALSRLGVATAIIAQTAKFHNIIYWIALFINIFFGLLLIPSIGVLGAILSTVIAEFVILLGWIYLGRIHLKNLPINWFMPLLILLFSFLFLVWTINQPIFEGKVLLLMISTLFTLSIFSILLYASVGKSGILKLYYYARD